MKAHALAAKLLAGPDVIAIVSTAGGPAEALHVTEVTHTLPTADGYADVPAVAITSYAIRKTA